MSEANQTQRKPPKAFQSDPIRKSATIDSATRPTYNLVRCDFRNGIAPHGRRTRPTLPGCYPRRRREVDQTEVPFRTKASFFDETTAKRIIIIGAVEIIDRSSGVTPRKKRKGAIYLNTRAGRIRLAVIPDNSSASIKAFVRANVEPESTLITDGHRSYLNLTEYRHDAHVVTNIAAHIPLPWIHRVFALMKRWGLGTYHGLRRKHVDTYLNEFVFRFIRRYHRKASFETLLGIASNGRPQTYWDITGKENGRKHRRPRRITPKRRKTTLGMRSDRLSRPQLPVSGG